MGDARPKTSPEQWLVLQRSAGVDSIEGYTEFLAIEEHFLLKEGPEFLLPISIVGKDFCSGSILVQLPLEADSGRIELGFPGQGSSTTRCPGMIFCDRKIREKKAYTVNGQIWH